MKLRRDGKQDISQEEKGDVDRSQRHQGQHQPGQQGPALAGRLFFQRNFGQARRTENTVIVLRDALAAVVMFALRAARRGLPLRMIRATLLPESKDRSAHGRLSDDRLNLGLLRRDFRVQKSDESRHPAQAAGSRQFEGLNIGINIDAARRPQRPIPKEPDEKRKA